ncbi:MAG TPA: hypothetical protein VMF87_35015 [Streptosporangiaceae bacterium]|nr:hypothetical protein [Streptosporangiaceae bacterium]
MERWLSKWEPVSGVVAGILLATAILSNGDTPGDSARAGQVFAFYLHNAAIQQAVAICGMLGMAFFVLFAVALGGRVRAAGTGGDDRPGRPERAGRAGGWLAYGTAATAVFAAAGAVSLLAFIWILASDIRFLAPSAAQTLNVLANDFYLPSVAGFFAFGVVAGLASTVSQTPVRWMGPVLVVFGIAAVIPPVTFFAVLAIFLWVLTCGAYLVAQGPPDVTEREPDIGLAPSSVSQRGR